MYVLRFIYISRYILFSFMNLMRKAYEICFETNFNLQISKVKIKLLIIHFNQSHSWRFFFSINITKVLVKFKEFFFFCQYVLGLVFDPYVSKYFTLVVFIFWVWYQFSKFQIFFITIFKLSLNLHFLIILNWLININAKMLK